VTRFSNIRNSSEFKRIKERTDVESTHLECVGAWLRWILPHRSSRTPRRGGNEPGTVVHLLFVLTLAVQFYVVDILLNCLL